MPFCIVAILLGDLVSCVTAVHRYIDLPYDYRNYCEYRHYCHYLTEIPGSLTGVGSVTEEKLPYLPGNFRVSTKITKNNLFCGNALLGNSQPSCDEASALNYVNFSPDASADICKSYADSPPVKTRKICWTKGLTET